MKRIFSTLLLSAILPAAAVGAVSTIAPSAEAQVVYYPSAAYVASYRPVYYNGYAHYWYGNHWWYRDHGAWRNYAVEPGYLHPYRAEWGRHYYGWR